ncbi:MAG: hypothetical protein HYX49_08400 [Chloroflexi bacterium]|nr:hypothetical protein [Chloroflexota bacterium]
MRKSQWILPVVLLIFVGISGCSFPLASRPAALFTPTVLVVPTLTPSTLLPGSLTAIPLTPNTPASTTLTALPLTFLPITPNLPAPLTQPPPPAFCADSQVTALIDSFKNALQTSNGGLLASLVSPVRGMDARYYRDGRVINYDQRHAKFLFESTYDVFSWGDAPGSGLPTKGSFHEIILPALLDVFNRNYTLTCNQIQVGGTTYQAAWPYAGVNFYSAYFAGTQGNGSLDWRTWLIGMEYVNSRPYLRAIMQFQWEP